MALNKKPNQIFNRASNMQKIKNGISSILSRLDGLKYRGWRSRSAALTVAVLSAGFLSNSIYAAEKITTRGNQVLYGGVAKGYAGNAFFWSNTGFGAERFYNRGAVSWLKNDWNSKIVRASMGVELNGGYLSDPAGNERRVKALVDAAIAEDIYVIIDWHSHNAENYTDQAVRFFTSMARAYGRSNNVIYEIYNEPVHSDWSRQIKPYAETVIAAIRRIDPDNLIVVGTPFYSQHVDVAAADPIRGQRNIAYALHFYAGSHSQDLRNRATRALNQGIPLFVTEWGAVNADGNGAVATAETNRWVQFMRQNNLSHLNWSIHDKQEGASSLRPGVSSNGRWSNGDLTDSGRLVKSIMLNYNRNRGGQQDRQPTRQQDRQQDRQPNVQPNRQGAQGGACSSSNAQNINGRVQAESFCNMRGIRTEPTQDNRGGENIGYIENGDWSEYIVNVPAASVTLTYPELVVGKAGKPVVSAFVFQRVDKRYG